MSSDRVRHLRGDIESGITVRLGCGLASEKAGERRNSFRSGAS
jgi:hypothetical protein